MFYKNILQTDILKIFLRLSPSVLTRGLDVFDLEPLVGRVGGIRLVPVRGGNDARGGTDALVLVKLDADVERFGRGLHHSVSRLTSCRVEEDSAEDVLVTNISSSCSACTQKIAVTQSELSGTCYREGW